MPKRRTYVGDVVRTKIKAFAGWFYVENGIPPTIDEIVENVDEVQSKSTIYYHLNTMVTTGEMRVYKRGSQSRYIPVGYKVVADE